MRMTGLHGVLHAPGTIAEDSAHGENFHVRCSLSAHILVSCCHHRRPTLKHALLHNIGDTGHGPELPRPSGCCASSESEGR